MPIQEMQGTLEITEETYFSLSRSAEDGEARLKRYKGGARWKSF